MYRTRKGTSGHKIHALFGGALSQGDRRGKSKKERKTRCPRCVLRREPKGAIKENRMDNGMSPIPVGSLECDKSPVYNHDKRGGREGEGEPVKIEGDFPGKFARERANWMCAHHGITTRFERVGCPVCKLRQGNSRCEAPRI